MVLLMSSRTARKSAAGNWAPIPTNRPLITGWSDDSELEGPLMNMREGGLDHSLIESSGLFASICPFAAAAGRCWSLLVRLQAGRTQNRSIPAYFPMQCLKVQACSAALIHSLRGPEVSGSSRSARDGVKGGFTQRSTTSFHSENPLRRVEPFHLAPDLAAPAL